MISASLSEPISIVIPSQESLPEDERVIFKIRPFTVSKMRQFMATYGGKKEHDITLDQVLELLKQFLVGWENVTDPEGNPIEFKFDDSGNCALENLDHLPFEIIQEVFTECFKANKLGKAIRKN